MTAPSALAGKLGVKPGNRVLLLDPPEGLTGALDPLPDGATVTTAEAAAGVPAGGRRVPVVLAFVRNAAALADAVPAALAAVEERGLLWLAYPKGGAKAGTDLNRDVLWQRVGGYGLAGVTLVAVDATWSAMRFRPAAEVGT